MESNETDELSMEKLRIIMTDLVSFLSCSHHLSDEDHQRFVEAVSVRSQLSLPFVKTILISLNKVIANVFVALNEFIRRDSFHNVEYVQQFLTAISLRHHLPPDIVAIPLQSLISNLAEDNRLANMFRQLLRQAGVPSSSQVEENVLIPTDSGDSQNQPQPSQPPEKETMSETKEFE
ncbi:hypothetical protein Avbf_17125 [Armadillidium vulgare]|nr:hypothetical protein Avbf_17125 [Armadillidium vulgare]